MDNLRFIIAFAKPFIIPYWRRLVLGLILGALFGLSQAVSIWAIKGVFERLDTQQNSTLQQAAKPAPPVSTKIFAGLKDQVSHRASVIMDDWFPHAGRPMTTRQLFGCLLFLPLLVILRGILDYSSNYYMKWVGERMLNDMRQLALEKINTLSLDYFSQSRTGDLHQRINRDTDSIAFAVKLGFNDLAKAPLAMIGIIGSLLWIDWQMTLFALLIIPACLIPVRVLGRKIYQASKGTVLNNASAGSLLVETIANARMIKAFNLEEHIEKRFRVLRDRFVTYGMRRHRAELLVNPLIETGSILAISGILVWVFATGKDTPDLVGFLAGLVLLFSPVKKLAGIHVTFQNARFGIDRLRETFGQMPTVRECASPDVLSGLQHGIEFQSVHFGYSDGIKVLEDISFTIQTGSSVGIAGESGSGKSSLVNLLFRFYDPTGGRVLVDGRDLKEFSLHSLRRQFSLVSQDVLLFDDTVMENIRLGRLDATEEEIVEAARNANADPFIRALEHGYSTRIGERGALLSGGQKQRISLARAFLRNAPLLVLDEATASLDSHAEREVQKSIDALAASKTVLCIAHRLATLRSCDLILVLHKGRIVERGSYDELLVRNGPFALMAAQQGLCPTPNPTRL